MQGMDYQLSLPTAKLETRTIILLILHPLSVSALPAKGISVTPSIPSEYLFLRGVLSNRHGPQNINDGSEAI